MGVFSAGVKVLKSLAGFAVVICVLQARSQAATLADLDAIASESTSLQDLLDNSEHWQRYSQAAQSYFRINQNQFDAIAMQLRTQIHEHPDVALRLWQPSDATPFNIPLEVQDTAWHFLAEGWSVFLNRLISELAVGAAAGVEAAKLLHEQLVSGDLAELLRSGDGHLVLAALDVLVNHPDRLSWPDGIVPTTAMPMIQSMVPSLETILNNATIFQVPHLRRVGADNSNVIKLKSEVVRFTPVPRLFHALFREASPFSPGLNSPQWDRLRAILANGSRVHFIEKKGYLGFAHLLPVNYVTIDGKLEQRISVEINTPLLNMSAGSNTLGTVADALVAKLEDFTTLLKMPIVFGEEGGYLAKPGFLRSLWRAQLVAQGYGWYFKGSFTQDGETPSVPSVGVNASAALRFISGPLFKNLPPFAESITSVVDQISSAPRLVLLAPIERALVNGEFAQLGASAKDQKDLLAITQLWKSHIQGDWHSLGRDSYPVLTQPLHPVVFADLLAHISYGEPTHVAAMDILDKIDLTDEQLEILLKKIQSTESMMAKTNLLSVISLPENMPAARRERLKGAFTLLYQQESYSLLILGIALKLQRMKEMNLTVAAKLIHHLLHPAEGSVEFEQIQAKESKHLIALMLQSLQPVYDQALLAALHQSDVLEDRIQIVTWQETRRTQTASQARRYNRTSSDPNATIWERIDAITRLAFAPPSEQNHVNNTLRNVLSHSTDGPVKFAAALTLSKLGTPLIDLVEPFSGHWNVTGQLPKSFRIFSYLWETPDHFERSLAGLAQMQGPFALALVNDLVRKMSEATLERRFDQSEGWEDKIINNPDLVYQFDKLLERFGNAGHTKKARVGSQTRNRSQTAWLVSALINNLPQPNVHAALDALAIEAAGITAANDNQSKALIAHMQARYLIAEPRLFPERLAERQARIYSYHMNRLYKVAGGATAVGVVSFLLSHYFPNQPHIKNVSLLLIPGMAFLAMKMLNVSAPAEEPRATGDMSSEALNKYYFDRLEHELKTRHLGSLEDFQISRHCDKLLW